MTQNEIIFHYDYILYFPNSTETEVRVCRSMYDYFFPWLRMYFFFTKKYSTFNLVLHAFRLDRKSFQLSSQCFKPLRLNHAWCNWSFTWANSLMCMNTVTEQWTDLLDYCYVQIYFINNSILIEFTPIVECFQCFLSTENLAQH